MQLTISALVAALCWSYRLAAASNSHVYTIDKPAVLREGRPPEVNLSPELARLVLAQRAGVEDYHGADLENEKVLQAINSHAAREGLFGERKADNVLVLVEGVDGEMETSYKTFPFAISPSPSANATRRLFLDLARQALPSYLSNLPDDEIYTILKGGAHERRETADRTIAIWSEMELHTYIDSILQAKDGHALSVTIITSPSSHHSGEKGADYGTYSMPASAQSPLHKRQQPTEEPLEIEPSTAPVSQSSDNSLNSLASSNSSAIPGILPACFSTLSACETTTRNCSGHGHCYKKYTDATAPKNSRFRDCYSCQCSATTVGSDDGEGGGVRTTYWGGPACQKKDVSVGFWLIVLFTVGMVGLVSFAVGTVWSMGEEELPSVIGAGVSGPVKRS